MIRKQDILDRASEWQLRPEVVEKDYVLGWLLAGLARMPFGHLWIFKGGTCIKKCYFETDRFSEDLDFSLLPMAAGSQDALIDQLRTLTASVATMSGLEFPADQIDVKPRRNQQGQPTFEGRVGYRGPLVYPGSPKIRFDFTQHEAVIDTPVGRPILHPYPDDLPAETAVTAYSFNEVLAEKTHPDRSSVIVLQLPGQQRGLPVAPHHLSHRRCRTDAAQPLIVFTRKHTNLLRMALAS